MRYKSIRAEDVRPGMDVRVALRHPKGWPTVTYEGKIERCEVETGRRGLIGNAPMPDALRALWGVGDFEMKLFPTTEWHVSWVEAGQPPLPSTRGSVILVQGRAASLRNVSYSDQPENLQWIWVDDLNVEQGPTDAQLEEAEIIHTAKASR